MSHRKRISSLICIMFVCSLCSCSLKNVTVNNTNQTDNTLTEETNIESNANSNYIETTQQTTEKTTVAINSVERKSKAAQNEKFLAYPLAQSGTIYATVNSVNYYNNIYNDEININNFSDNIYKYNESYDDSGNILPMSDNISTVFVMVNVTVENIDAETFLNTYTTMYKDLYPDLFSDGFCDIYDFSAGQFGININKVLGATDMNNIGGSGVDYFSLKSELYTDEHRNFFFNLKPGESINFDIGRFMPIMIGNDSMANEFGGQIGDSLCNRYILNFTNSINDITVNLEQMVLE